MCWPLGQGHLQAVVVRLVLVRQAIDLSYVWEFAEQRPLGRPGQLLRWGRRRTELDLRSVASRTIVVLLQMLIRHLDRKSRGAAD